MADIVEILKEKLNLPEERLLELIAIGKERTISRNNRLLPRVLFPGSLALWFPDYSGMFIPMKMARNLQKVSFQNLVLLVLTRP
jgi:hypothetical protein